MKTALFLLLFFSITLGMSQTPTSNQLVGITTATQAEINAIANPIEGSLIYNTDDKLLYQYNGSTWSKRSSEGNETIITSAEHTTITGAGTSIDPYIVSSPIPSFTSNADGSFTFSNGVDDDVLFIPVTPASQPIVTSVTLGESTCTYLGINETRDIFIYGSYFNGSSLVNIPGLSINSITINSSTQVTVNITTGSTVGYFDVSVSNNIGSSTLIEALFIENPSTPTTKTIALSEMTLNSAMTYDGVNLEKTGPSGWDGEGYSTNHAISSAGGRLDFTANQTNRYIMAGLSYDPAITSSHTNLNFGIYLVANAEIQIRESGTSLGYVSSYAIGDVFSIVIDCSGKVTYFINGTLLYTSSNIALGPLFFDSSAYSIGSAVSDILITY